MPQALLRAPNTANVGSVNTFGDQQVEADVEADRVVFDALRSCGAVACASSEETTDVQNLGGNSYSVRLVTMVPAPSLQQLVRRTSERCTCLGCRQEDPCFCMSGRFRPAGRQQHHRRQLGGEHRSKVHRQNFGKRMLA